MLLGSRFKVMCADAGLTSDQVAKLLRVTDRTVRYWFSGQTSVPYASYRLLRILCRYELPDPAWAGWLMHSGKLWSPEGHGFDPADSNWWGLLCFQARLFRESCERDRQFDALVRRARGSEPGAERRAGVADRQAAPGDSPGPEAPASGRREAPGLNLSLRHFGTRGEIFGGVSEEKPALLVMLPKWSVRLADTNKSGGRGASWAR